MPTTNFYFGRVHFRHQLTSLEDFDEDLTRAERVRKALFEYVSTDEVVYEDQDSRGNDVQWVFGVVVEEEDFFVGHFGKVYTDRPTTYSFDRGEFVEGDTEQTEADYSTYLVYPEENLIIFNQRQHIGYRQFQTAFAEGYSNYVGIDDAISIALLQDTAEIETLIQESEIKYIDFDLVPTNPTSDPDMQALDDHIQNMEAESFGMSAEADGGGINMDDDLMQAALNMSVSGYGEFEMDYERDDRRDRYRSTDRPAAKEIQSPDTLSDLVGRAGDLIGRARELVSSSTSPQEDG